MPKPRLQAELTLDDSKFQAGIRRAEGNALRFGASVKNKLTPIIAGSLAGAGVALASAFGYRTFQAGIRGAIDAGERLNDLRLITGASITSLSKLSDVFEIGGGSADMLENSISRMQRALFEAQKGTKTYAALFRMLGIDVADFAKLEPDEQFLKLGKAINGLANPTHRAGIAMGLFGRSGAQLLEKFADFNTVDFADIDRRAQLFARNAERFDNFNASVRRARLSIQELWVVLASKLLPLMQKSADVISNVDFGSFVAQIAEALRKTVTFPQMVTKVLGGDKKVLEAAGAAVGAAVFGGVKQRNLLPKQPETFIGGARPSVSLIPSSTGGIDAFKARGVNTTLPQLQERRLGAAVTRTGIPGGSGLNAAKAPIGLDSVLLGPSTFAGGTRKRGETKEDFRARMNALKAGEKAASEKDTSLEGLVKQIVDTLKGQ